MSLDFPLLLTLVGLVAAARVARRRASRFGLELQKLHSLMLWIFIGGLLGGHLVDGLYYRFDQVAEVVQSHEVWRHPAELLRPWHGWRSVGGLFGALAAALLWQRYRFESTVVLRATGVFELEAYWFVKRARPVPLLALADVVLSVFPLAWALHRVGSALASDGSNIGLFDLLITSVLLVVVAVLWKGRFRTGTYVCLAGLTYAPARVVLDFVSHDARSAPELLGAFTLTQWGFAIATLLSLGLFIRLRWSVSTVPPAIS